MLPGDTPGPFMKIDQLTYNEPIYIYAWGLKYTYGVISKQVVSPTDFSVLNREQKDVITLISCKAYDPQSDSYLLRMVVKATLVKIEKDPLGKSDSFEEKELEPEDEEYFDEFEYEEDDEDFDDEESEFEEDDEEDFEE